MFSTRSVHGQCFTIFYDLQRLNKFGHKYNNRDKCQKNCRSEVKNLMSTNEKLNFNTHPSTKTFIYGCIVVLCFKGIIIQSQL